MHDDYHCCTDFQNDLLVIMITTMVIDDNSG